MSHLDLKTVDVDGALQEAAEDNGLGRADFFKKGAVVGAGAIAGGALFGPFLANAEAAISTRRKSRANDVKIANYALTLEFLEAEFYAQALRNNAFSNDLYRKFGQIVADHEAKHVTALRRLLGARAIKKPTFDFGDTVTNPTKFAQTAQVLEDTGVAAYAGQGPNILQRAVVQAALSIHSVEARHAGWIRFLNSAGNGPVGILPAPATFDRPLSERAVLAAVGETGFIEG